MDNSEIPPVPKPSDSPHNPSSDTPPREPTAGLSSSPPLGNAPLDRTGSPPLPVPLDSPFKPPGNKLNDEVRVPLIPFLPLPSLPSLPSNPLHNLPSNSPDIAPSNPLHNPPNLLPNHPPDSPPPNRPPESSPPNQTKGDPETTLSPTTTATTDCEKVTATACGVTCITTTAPGVKIRRRDVACSTACSTDVACSTQNTASTTAKTTPACATGGCLPYAPVEISPPDGDDGGDAPSDDSPGVADDALCHADGSTLVTRSLFKRRAPPPFNRIGDCELGVLFNKPHYPFPRALKNLVDRKKANRCGLAEYNAYFPNEKLPWEAEGMKTANVVGYFTERAGACALSGEYSGPDEPSKVPDPSSDHICEFAPLVRLATSSHWNLIRGAKLPRAFLAIANW